MHRLRPPARVERDVAAALQAALDVPVGLAVADVVDGRRRHSSPRKRVIHFELTLTAMSGASGCLMPTMW